MYFDFDASIRVWIGIMQLPFESQKNPAVAQQLSLQLDPFWSPLLSFRDILFADAMSSLRHRCRQTTIPRAVIGQPREGDCNCLAMSVHYFLLAPQQPKSWTVAACTAVAQPPPRMGAGVRGTCTPFSVHIMYVHLHTYHTILVHLGTPFVA